VSGIAPLSHLGFELEPQPSATLFTQLMLDRGFLAGKAFYPSFAHAEQQIASYLDAVCEVFSIIGEAQQAGSVLSMLRGPVAHAGFQRLT
jgi:hypothetical protein